jgi:hypothetical protein
VKISHAKLIIARNSVTTMRQHVAELLITFNPDMAEEYRKVEIVHEYLQDLRFVLGELQEKLDTFEEVKL